MKISLKTFATQKSSCKELGMAEMTEFQGEKKMKGRLEVGWKWRCSPSQRRTKSSFRPFADLASLSPCVSSGMPWRLKAGMASLGGGNGMQLSQKEELWWQEKRDEGTPPTKMLGMFYGACLQNASVGGDCSKPVVFLKEKREYPWRELHWQDLPSARECGMSTWKVSCHKQFLNPAGSGA